MNAISSQIALKENIEIFETGNGTVWDPDPGTYLQNINLLDNNDTDYQALQPVYKNVQLLGLNPENGTYYLRGDYAYSYDIASPNDPVTGLSTPNFNFNRSQNGFEETNCYYHLDKTIRYVHDLGFSPAWDNLTNNNQNDIVFDARGTLNRNAYYYPSSEYIIYGVPSTDKDAGEDQSVIIHELGHGLHDALLIGGIDNFTNHPICRGISEGISDYLGIDYRRQLSHFRPNDRCNWFWTGITPTIQTIPECNFQNLWTNYGPYEKMRTWASSLMDLEYITATDPSQGIRLGRDVVTTNQLSALSYITGNATTEENVLAMYQADLDTYEGEHLREYIDTYHNRLLFNDQNVFTDVSQNTNWSGYKKINDVIHVISGKTLTIEPYSVIVMNGELNVNAGANLIVGDHVLFIGYIQAHKVSINGNIQIGQNVTFAIGSLYLNNNALQTTFTGTTFNGTELINYGSKLTMNNCTFNSCNYAYSFRGSVFVNNSSFTNTWLYLENQSQVASATAHILGCNFNNANTNVGIDLRNFNKYLISDNDIKAKKNGIQVNYCCSGPAGNKGIFRNSIHNCSWAGVLAYNTSGIIENNTIFNNGVGIKLMNNCNMAVIGNPDAQTLSQTQQIRDNESYEVYITQFSFPYLFQYNAIIDEDNIGNPTDPMLLYSNAGINYPQFPKWYVENNCWGSNFNYEDDLWVSYGTFKVYPTWCPSGAQPIDDDPIKEMFADAMDKINNGYYNDAKNILQYLVQNYPRSIQGQSAMKELLIVEEYLGKDFAGLKNYYRTNDSIVSDSLLKKLGDFLGNQCDIKLGNWPDAIDWFENRILNPACLEDSIFSIIDLGNVYFLMENQGLKSAYSGNLKQFIPETKSKYFGT